jgi:hypothetical protein
MNDQSEQSIQTLGARSSLMVWGLTCFFAISAAGIGFLGFYQNSLAWLLIGMAWVPVLFLVIPAVHFLCRELLRLQRRMKELEKRLGQG